MTRDEFAQLYKHSSEVLHTRNPYKQGDPTINIGYTVHEWATRFRNLIRWHFMTLVNGNVLLCNTPDQRLVHVYSDGDTDRGVVVSYWRSTFGVGGIGNRYERGAPFPKRVIVVTDQ